MSDVAPMFSEATTTGAFAGRGASPGGGWGGFPGGYAVECGLANFRMIAICGLPADCGSARECELLGAMLAAESATIPEDDKCEL